jgi:hypothetical protein
MNIVNIIILIGVLIYAYPVGFLVGSIILRKILVFIDESYKKHIGGAGINYRNSGFWIGACEHFLIVTFILVGQYTALGILVAARGILRIDMKPQDSKVSEKEKQDAIDRVSYFLLGMLLSICFATFFGITTKLILFLLKHPLVHILKNWI